LNADEDKLEAVEKQICKLLEKQAQLRDNIWKHPGLTITLFKV